jgi:hypothetical protein
VGSCCSSWLITSARSASIVDLHWCSSPSWASMAARSPVSSRHCCTAPCSMSSCRACYHSSWWASSHSGRSLVFGCCTTGMAGVTTLQSQRIVKLELSPSLEVELSSLVDSSRMACSDGDPLRTMPTNTTPESFPSGDRPLLSKWWAMNSRFFKRMVLPQAIATSNW